MSTNGVWEPLSPETGSGGLADIEAQARLEAATREVIPEAGSVEELQAVQRLRNVYTDAKLRLSKRCNVKVIMQKAFGKSSKSLVKHDPTPTPKKDGSFGFDLSVAKAFATLSKLASCGEAPGLWHSLQASCGSTCSEAGFEVIPRTVQYISLEKPKLFHKNGMPGSLTGYVAKIAANEGDQEDEACLLVFRGGGEASVEEEHRVIHSRSDLAKLDDCHGCKVHAGYGATWKAFAPEVQRQIKKAGCFPPMQTYVTGYSFGAAVGILAMWHLAAEGFELQPSYFFELPPVGNARFAKRFQEKLHWDVPIFRVTHGLPPFATKPQLGSALRHISEELHFPRLDDSKVYTACAGLNAAMKGCESDYLLDKALGDIRHGSLLYLRNPTYQTFLGVCGTPSRTCSNASFGLYSYDSKSEINEFILEIKGGSDGMRLLPDTPFYLKNVKHGAYIGTCGMDPESDCGGSSYSVGAFSSKEAGTAFKVEISDGEIYLKSAKKKIYIGVCGEATGCEGSRKLAYGFDFKDGRGKWIFEVKVPVSGFRAEKATSRCPSPLAPDGSFCNFGDGNDRFIDVCVLGQPLTEEKVFPLKS